MRSLDNARQDGDAGKRHRAAAELVEPLALDGSEAANHQADTNAEGVQESGREHETRPIKRARAKPGHFRAVGVAMKDRKECDDRHDDRERRACFEHHRTPEDYH